MEIVKINYNKETIIIERRTKGECSMYEIIVMEADYEPWWQFDGWEDYVIETFQFDTALELEAHLQMLLRMYRQKYPNEECRNENFYAFWDENEQFFCDACDDDAQLYHGIIVRYEA